MLCTPLSCWIFRGNGKDTVIIGHMKICHLTSVHPENDTRIFLKECVSLQRAGHDVYFVVAGASDKSVSGVQIVGTKKIKGRIMRILVSWRPVLRTALKVDADIYHLHDPELLKAGVALRRHGKKVIYDSHEDLPRQILAKPWIPRLLRPIISHLIEFVENSRVHRLSAVVAATPHIAERFEWILPGNVCNINNYPILDEITSQSAWNQRHPAICYVGGIFRERGIAEMLAVAASCQVPFILAGTFAPASLLADVKSMPGWQFTDYKGYVGRKEINDILGQSMVGLLLLHPLPSYKDSLPIKLFEYMAAGIPVVCSDFPLWRSIVDDCGCGICVPPLDVSAAAAAVRRLIDHPDEAEAMGRRGRQAVEQRFNWKTQEALLIQFYNKLSMI